MEGGVSRRGRQGGVVNLWSLSHSAITHSQSLTFLFLMLALASAFPWHGCLDSRSTCTCSGPYSHWTLALFLVFPMPPPVSHSTSAVTSLGRALNGSQPSHCLLTGFPLQLPSSPTHGLCETDSPFHMAVIWSRTFLGSHCLWNRPSRIVADWWIAL